MSPLNFESNWSLFSDGLGLIPNCGVLGGSDLKILLKIQNCEINSKKIMEYRLFHLDKNNKKILKYILTHKILKIQKFHPFSPKLPISHKGKKLS